jgi:transposase
MKKGGDAFVGIDTAKLKNAVAIAESGRDGEVRYFGEIPNTPEATRKLVGKLVEKYRDLTFCYEAGPTGYGLYRQITELGHRCMVVAPSLIPRRTGDRVKTNRRDAVSLAKLLRAGELTETWVPDTIHEAVRDLSRAREAVVEDLRRKRQQVSAFMLRHGRVYPGKRTWTVRYMRWLGEQRFEHPAQRVALDEMLNAVKDASERQSRLETALAEIIPGWTMAPVVAAFQAMRGISFVAAATVVAEIGDMRRFATPRQLMSYLGLVPSERSTGDTVRRGPITKTGNRRARRVLVEGAWTYRYGARMSREILERTRDVPKTVRDIAWKAQSRLCARYRRLTSAGKLKTVTTTAIAREMAAFLWAIAREVPPVVAS